MRRIIMGTAGHVDHGKTTLVKAITGVNTDRWEEERRRGLTIDLGFAPFTLPSGKKAAIIDVPGHERFIKNMLAGVSSIDVVILVVAADEGVMPQTDEHLDILNLLQVKYGVVAVTKKDLVDAELLELVQEDIKERLVGTTLENAPLVPVSAVTGDGIPELLAQVEKVVSEAEKSEPSKLLRLPIDRVFQISGHGTVVTGTLLGGTIQIKDEVEIQPAGIRAKVRQIQVHDEPVSSVEAGQRVALNLAGVEKSQLKRGDVILEPGLLEPTTIVDVKISVLEKAKELSHGERVRVHVGTSEVLARLRVLGAETVEPGQTGYGQLMLEDPVVVARGDLFVIRTYSPAHTVAGGKILSGNPLRWKRKSPDTLEILRREDEGHPLDLLRLSFERVPTTPLTRDELRKKTLLDPGELRTQIRTLLREGEIIDLENNQVFLWSAGEKQLWEKAGKLLEAFHAEYPMRKGYSKEELRSRLVPDWEPKLFASLLEHWVQVGRINVYDKEVGLPGKGLQLGPEEERIAGQIEEELLSAGYSPPNMADLAAKFNQSGEGLTEILNYLLLKGSVVKVSEGIIFHRDNLEKAKELAKNIIQEEGGLETAAFRDATESSRKYAIALLEYFDEIKWTKRVGDKRIAGTAMKDAKDQNPTSTVSSSGE
ncbi:MAG: selenocysteine-specific translation elongation factor [Firmicutes bacterium]|nr:selenocysteine-specific translation elongation factor [Bacillota bacterium]